MRKSRKMIQVFILIAVVIVGGYAIGTSLFGNDQKGQLQLGHKPPTFELSNLTNGTTSLSDYEGQPVVINFWGSFCEPCVKEMPAFQKQYDKWKSQGLVILAINLSEDSLTVSNFVNRFELDYPILRDVNRRTERNYGIRSYPTTIFVKPDGDIDQIIVGGMEEEDINQHIERLLQL